MAKFCCMSNPKGAASLLINCRSNPLIMKCASLHRSPWKPPEASKSAAVWASQHPINPCRPTIALVLLGQRTAPIWISLLTRPDCVLQYINLSTTLLTVGFKLWLPWCGTDPFATPPFGDTGSWPATQNLNTTVQQPHLGHYTRTSGHLKFF